MMKNNIKLFIYDIKNITKDKKSFFVICFFTFLTIFIGVTISIFFKDNNKSLFNEIKIISNIDRADVFTLYITYIFSFVLFSTYPFLTGIVIISYLKEFGELELMMLFPLNRKHFFFEKIFCIFVVSIFFSWISIFLNFIIHCIIYNLEFSFNGYIFFYATVSLPVWLFCLSSLTVVISSLAKDSKEANQKSLIISFILYCIIQVLFLLKVNFLSIRIIFIPLLAGIILVIGLFCFVKNKINLEKILYY